MLQRRRLPKFSLLSFATRMKILRRQSLLLAFLALLGSLGSIAFAWQFVAPLRAGFALRDWVEVPSEILASHAIEISDIDIVALFVPELAGIEYTPWIRYSYRYDGARYIGIALSPVEERYSTRDGAETRLSSYRSGTTSKCFVNPESPRESVMSRRSVPASFRRDWLLGALVLAAANIPFVRKRRQIRRAVRQEFRFSTYIEDAQPDKDLSRFSDLKNGLSFEFASTPPDDAAEAKSSGAVAIAPDSLRGPSLVNKIIEDALDAEATEVLLQTRNSAVHVSYRIAGLLCSIAEIPEESLGAFHEDMERLSNVNRPGESAAGVSVLYDGQQYALRTVSEVLPWGERAALHLSPLPKP